MIVETKLITETKRGSLIKVPATLKYDGGRIWFVKSPFSLKDEIKAMKGARWHGFEDPPIKQWSVEDCPRNAFQLDYMQGKNVFEWFDQEPVKHEYTRPLMEHQKELADACLTYHYHILAAEMGCVSGDAIVHVNRAGRGFKMKLSDLHKKLEESQDHGGRIGQRKWDSSIPTMVRSLKGDTLGLHRCVKSLYKGEKETVRVTLKSGKSVVVTLDHEIYTGFDTTCEAGKLEVGQTVLSNGTWTDKDGYVRVGGLKGKHHRWTTGGVYEHILVAEKMLGRPITASEHVHHRNRIKHDNRPENLEVLSGKEHIAGHGQRGGFKQLHGGRVQFVPHFDEVVSVEPAGVQHVYDLVMEDPHRNFVADGVVVHNCGKTLVAQEVIERSGHNLWFWVGPKSSLPNMDREFRKWSYQGPEIKWMTYEGLVKWVREYVPGDPIPGGIVGDESSKCKTATSQRSRAFQKVADMIREEHGMNGYVIEMSGTPSPKRPTDWWSQCEIAYPGFLKEGTPKAMEKRMAFMKELQLDGTSIMQVQGWRDDESKCDNCGKYEDDNCHDFEMAMLEGVDHCTFTPSKNEVALLFERLHGLVTVKHKKDCLDLPDKRYRVINCEIKPSVHRAAKVLMDTAPNTITGLTWLRELSDGFQYREIIDGTKKCDICKGTGKVEDWFHKTDPNYDFAPGDLLDEELASQLEKRDVDCPNCGGACEVPRKVREARQVKCPKEDALRGLLGETEEVGRIVIFAGFTGSVDRCKSICQKEGWSIVRCDGRGFEVTNHKNEIAYVDNPLDFWADMENNPRVAFVAHPESGGMSLTLTEARMAVFYSNSFKPEYRAQAEDRIHRTGMDLNLGCEIVDLIHLPTDERVLEVLRDNRRLELMTMGDFEYDMAA